MFNFEVLFVREGVTVTVPVSVDDEMLIDFAMYFMDEGVLKFCADKETETIVRSV